MQLAPPFVGGLMAVVLVVVAIAVIAAQRAATRRREEMKQRAQMRGWQFEIRRGSREDGSIYQYSGNTDGIAWRFLTTETGITARWESPSPPLQNEVLGVFNSGGKKDITAPTNAPKFLIGLAARALTLAVGTDGVDAKLFATAGPVMPPGPGLEAYLFRATRPELMLRFLECGAADALKREAQRSKSSRTALTVFSAGHQGTRLLMHGKVDADRIAEIVKLGAALATAVGKAQRPA